VPLTSGELRRASQCYRIEATGPYAELTGTTRLFLNCRSTVRLATLAMFNFAVEGRDFTIEWRFCGRET
jgi:hypothetical protein